MWVSHLSFVRFQIDGIRTYVDVDRGLKDGKQYRFLRHEADSKYCSTEVMLRLSMKTYLLTHRRDEIKQIIRKNHWFQPETALA